MGEKETEPETCPEELKPQLKEDVELKSDRITIELNNKTNGEYSDNEIYWCIVGNNSSDELCYLDKDGNMVRASETLNTVSVNGGKYADIYHRHPKIHRCGVHAFSGRVPADESGRCGDARYTDCHHQPTFYLMPVSTISRKTSYHCKNVSL